MAATTRVRLLVWTFSRTLSFGVAAVGADFHPACRHPTCTPSKRTGICTNSRKCGKTAIESWPVIWVHSSVVRAADCRSAGPWFKSGCALVTPYHNSAAALLCCIRLRFFQSRRYAARPASGLPPKGARLWPQRWLWWARSETTLAWATASQLKAARPPGPERRKLVAAGRGPTYTRSTTMRIA